MGFVVKRQIDETLYIIRQWELAASHLKHSMTHPSCIPWGRVHLFHLYTIPTYTVGKQLQRALFQETYSSKHSCKVMKHLLQPTHMYFKKFMENEVRRHDYFDMNFLVNNV